MSKRILILTLILLLLISLLILSVFSGCRSDTKRYEDRGTSGPSDINAEEIENPEEIESVEDIREKDTDTEVQVISISPEEVLEIIENGKDHIIVDVRT